MDEILLLNVDVSFAATSFALADLARDQAVQDKLRQEVDETLRGADPSSCPDLDKKLPYMEMALKESARMNPALALSLPEKTVKPLTDIGGYQIPKGVTNTLFRFTQHPTFSSLNKISTPVAKSKHYGRPSLSDCFIHERTCHVSLRGNNGRHTLKISSLLMQK